MLGSESGENPPADGLMKSPRYEPLLRIPTGQMNDFLGQLSRIGASETVQNPSRTSFVVSIDPRSSAQSRPLRSHEEFAPLLKICRMSGGRCFNGRKGVLALLQLAHPLGQLLVTA